MCYNWVIKSARFLHLPAAALAIADSGPVGKEGALRTMLARLPRASMGQVVLLTCSESLHPTQLLSRRQSTPISPLAATLMNSLASVANKRLTAELSPLDATLSKNRGVGGVWSTPLSQKHLGWGYPLASRRKEIPHQVKENRRGKAQRINPVENAAMTLDHCSEIFHPGIALDRAHHQSARETEQRNHERHSGGLQRRERRRPPQRRAQQRRRRHAAQETLPRFVRADAWRDLVFSRELSPDVLQDVAHLVHQNKVEQQLRVAARKPGNVENQQRRRMAQAKRANHQAELDFRRALQEVLRVAGHGDPRRHKHKREHRNHDREKSIPGDSDQVVLQRRDDEKAPQQRPVIPAPRRHQRDVLAQRQQRQQPKQDQRPDPPDQQRQGEDRAHLPPRARPRIQVVNRGPRRIALRRALEYNSNRARQNQNAQHAAKESREMSIPRASVPTDCLISGYGVAQQMNTHRSPFRWSAQTAARARSRNASLLSLSSTSIGAPNVSTLINGTGRNSPFGKIRFRFSKYTGTSSASGLRFARWKRPLRNGATASPVPRVPSGNRINESVSPSASASCSMVARPAARASSSLSACAAAPRCTSSARKTFCARYAFTPLSQ